mgnify:CR=1 FL=1
MNLDKIFVVHYEPLTERKKYIDESLKRLQGIPIEYVIMNSDTDRFVNENFQRFYQGSSKISFQEVAVSIAHLEIFKDILHNNYKKCLIIEDDAILEDLFFDNIDKAISESDEFDFSFLSSCSNFFFISLLFSYKNLLLRSISARVLAPSQSLMIRVSVWSSALITGELISFKYSLK